MQTIERPEFRTVRQRTPEERAGIAFAAERRNIATLRTIGRHLKAEREAGRL